MQIESRLYATLKNCREFLSAQEYRTIKGQIRAGDTLAAIKGLQTVLNRNTRKEENHNVK